MTAAQQSAAVAALQAARCSEVPVPARDRRLRRATRPRRRVLEERDVVTALDGTRRRLAAASSSTGSRTTRPATWWTITVARGEDDPDRDRSSWPASDDGRGHPGRAHRPGLRAALRRLLRRRRHRRAQRGADVLPRHLRQADPGRSDRRRAHRRHRDDRRRRCGRPDRRHPAEDGRRRRGRGGVVPGPGRTTATTWSARCRTGLQVTAVATLAEAVSGGRGHRGRRDDGFAADLRGRARGRPEAGWPGAQSSRVAGQGAGEARAPGPDSALDSSLSAGAPGPQDAGPRAVPQHARRRSGPRDAEGARPASGAPPRCPAGACGLHLRRHAAARSTVRATPCTCSGHASRASMRSSGVGVAGARRRRRPRPWRQLVQLVLLDEQQVRRGPTPAASASSAGQPPRQLGLALHAPLRSGRGRTAGQGSPSRRRPRAPRPRGRLAAGRCRCSCGHHAAEPPVRRSQVAGLPSVT